MDKEEEQEKDMDKEWEEVKDRDKKKLCRSATL